jgi:trans-aconitate methyltransferase
LRGLTFDHERVSYPVQASLDPSLDLVERAAQAGVDAQRGCAQRMPFGEAPFDMVVASAVLEHLEPGVRTEG